MVQNKHLFKNIMETFGLDPNEARTFFLDENDTTAFDANEIVELNSEDDYDTWDGRADAFKQHHTIDIQYPSLDLLLEPNEEFLLNKPQNAHRRYAPFPLIRDGEIQRIAARDGLADNAFYSVYRCHQQEPDISTRHLTSKDVFADLEEAIEFHGLTQLSAVVFRNTQRPDLGPLIRIRRSTRFRWKDVVDYNECTYDLSMRDFMAARGRPAWYQDLVHLIGIESDRAARFIALMLIRFKQTGRPREDLFEVYPKFLKSFERKPRWLEDYEEFLAHRVVPYKSSIMQRTPKCMHCKTDCSKGVSLPCSAKHVIHWECLMDVCDHVEADKLGCGICHEGVFLDPEDVNKLKFNIHEDGIFYVDDRYTRWENFEKSCSDLDSTRASSNETHITISRDFMIDLWQKFVDAGVEASIPEHLHHDRSDEYVLLEWEIDAQLTSLEGVSTAIWMFERWLKRRVFIRFRREFLKAGLDSSLSPSEQNNMRRHDFMRKILRKGWYDAYLRNLNRMLQFLSLRACECTAGHGKVYHTHGGRSFYSRQTVEKEQANITPARQAIYQWQETPQAIEMMREFKRELRRGDVEAGRYINDS